MSTDQEKFWEGEFGDSYISRNQSDGLLAANLSLFSDILQKTGPIDSVLELGCNVGMNLMALELLAPKISISGIDINQKAIDELKKEKPDYNLYQQSIIDSINVDIADLTFTKGVLIHINPEKLNNVYENLYEKSNKFICINEYYNPSPVTINYRGHDDRLFKRDFCGEMMDKYSDLKLVDYGFGYRRDPVFQQDDMTWFLLEK
jgi:pseudaminic acid biosynthesis-associated methylase|tara:strand:+ start:2141 stop:2752 length:612 start_codon:yes stop_codon:yes gene_type:complete